MVPGDEWLCWSLPAKHPRVKNSTGCWNYTKHRQSQVWPEGHVLGRKNIHINILTWNNNGRLQNQKQQKKKKKIETVRNKVFSWLQEQIYLLKYPALTLPAPSTTIYLTPQAMKFSDTLSLQHIFGWSYHFSNYFDLLVFMLSRENICQKHYLLKNKEGGFPGDSRVKSCPASAGDTGSTPGPGGSHMP